MHPLILHISRRVISRAVSSASSSHRPHSVGTSLISSRHILPPYDVCAAVFSFPFRLIPHARRLFRREHSSTPRRPHMRGPHMRGPVHAPPSSPFSEIRYPVAPAMRAPTGWIFRTCGYVRFPHPPASQTTKPIAVEPVRSAFNSQGLCVNQGVRALSAATF